MSDSRAGDLPLTGGCQCGAVRYALHARPEGVHVCHCRMCQKAVGGPFAALAPVRLAYFAWTRGAPALFRSSSAAERGFCSACGTPLTYRFVEGPNISVTGCSLDDPEAIRPDLQYSIDRKLSWIGSLDGLPGKRLDEFITPELAKRFVDHQHPDEETK